MPVYCDFSQMFLEPVCFELNNAILSCEPIKTKIKKKIIERDIKAALLLLLLSGTSNHDSLVYVICVRISVQIRHTLL